MDLNRQLPQPVELREDGSLAVHSIWRTIQGEGPFAGRAAIFVRLHGCTIQCPHCDTDYTSVRHLLTVDKMVSEIEYFRSQAVQHDLIILTGGEPFRQNIIPLCTALAAKGHNVQIETNGTCWLDDWYSQARIATIVCSPKTTRVHQAFHSEEVYWKYVLSHDSIDSKDGLPLSALGMSQRPARPKWMYSDLHPLLVSRIFVQPEDVQDDAINQRNLEAAARSCLTYGYTLCVQMHKLAGLP